MTRFSLPPTGSYSPKFNMQFSNILSYWADNNHNNSLTVLTVDSTAEKPIPALLNFTLEYDLIIRPVFLCKDN